MRYRLALVKMSGSARFNSLSDLQKYLLQITCTLYNVALVFSSFYGTYCEETLEQNQKAVTRIPFLATEE